MPRPSKTTRTKKLTTKRTHAEKQRRPRPITSYDHKLAERVNNPPVGLLHADNDPDLAAGRKTYAYDPHLDPQLVWAGKAEHTSFDVPTVSLNVHERIDPRTIIEAVRKKGTNAIAYEQLSLFHTARENPPYREAIEFYKHRHNWSNRLVAGDSLLVMNSLLEKEGMAGQVQMIYIDPPYGIKYGSNFQPFVNNRSVTDGNDEDLTQEPEMVKAFRDTWELGIHSYLAYLRDRLLLTKELLSESGSVFVQISDENVHHVIEIMSEVFRKDNFVTLITFSKTRGLTKTNTTPVSSDFLVHFAKDKSKIKYHHLFREKILGSEGTAEFRNVELSDGTTRRMTDEEYSNPRLLPSGAKVYATTPIVSQGYSETGSQEIKLSWEGRSYTLRSGSRRHWSVGVEGTRKLWEMGRLLHQEGLRIFKSYLNDFPYAPITNVWSDTRSETDPIYVVQTNRRVIERCMLMTTDPGDLVIDPTCGSGTTAHVAEQWGRRWITCDTSRVSITLAKQRLMTAFFDYYELAHPDEGVDSGFRYQVIPHHTISSIANEETPVPETLYDKPGGDSSRARVAGPFTVEAVPAPGVKPLAETKEEQPADESIARSGETLRQAQWRDELFRTGIRGKGGQKIEFTRVEPLLATRWLHADAETKEAKPQRVVLAFGSAYAPFNQTHFERAMEEAESLVPKPKLVVFAAFQFDPEASKDIEETNWAGGTILKVQMNTDLLTDDLKKNRASNESFWLIGQPDVTLETIKSGADKGKYQVEVHGFDYYNTRTGNIESGSNAQIAIWLLDPDYDGRSLFPRQVFFPMAGDKEGWAKLAHNLKAEIDEDLIEAYRGTASLPFALGEHKRVGVKIIDDRGIESLKIIEVD